MFVSSYHFNLPRHLSIFLCLNTFLCALINEYWTGLKQVGEVDICWGGHLLRQTFVEADICWGRHLSRQTFVKGDICWGRHLLRHQADICWGRHLLRRTFVESAICWVSHLYTCIDPQSSGSNHLFSSDLSIWKALFYL
jgi:hypothetical protein